MRTKFALLHLLLAGGLAVAQSPAKPALPPAADVPIAPKTVHSFDLSGIDTTVNPCVNFYQYACGNWRRNNPIPPDQAHWGTFNQLGDRNRYLLYAELQQAADAPKSPLQKQYGDFFAACMDVNRANQLGAKPILPTLYAIDALANKKEIALLLANPDYPAAGFFDLESDEDARDSRKQIADIEQDGISLPDRDYYLSDDEHTASIRLQYLTYLRTVFGLIGDSPERAKTEADAVLAVETRLAKGYMSRVAHRNPENTHHPMSLSDLVKLAPDFDWNAYIKERHAPAFTVVNVEQPEFLQAMNAVLANESLSTLKSYLRFQAVNATAPNLSAAFDDAYTDFFLRVLQGQAGRTPRWKRCTTLTDKALGEAVGQDWVKQNLPSGAREDMEKLVAQLRKALAEDIDQLHWMSPETKQQAEVKLAAIRQKIAYPETWRDYSKVEVRRGDLVGNLTRTARFNQQFNLNHIGKPSNADEWYMTPPTANANYYGPLNYVEFPAGILQPPFYEMTLDPAVNFGAIGATIGHEMTHGFDDKGSRYDAQGNLHDWWTKEDKAGFDQRATCIRDEYGSFAAIPDHNLNGSLTLGENIADNGGLRIAYLALQRVLAEEGPEAETQKIDGYTPDQRFFIANAQTFCENRSDEYNILSIKTNPHSPNEFRVNGTVRNFEQFGKAFACHQDQPMMPAQTCRVW